MLNLRASQSLYSAEHQTVRTSGFFVRSYKASQGLRQTFRERTGGLKSGDMKLKTVGRAAWRSSFRIIEVQNEILAKNIAEDRSVIRELGHMEEAILYMYMLGGFVLTGYELASVGFA
jgi:hypothetical protein